MISSPPEHRHGEPVQQLLRLARQAGRAEVSFILSPTQRGDGVWIASLADDTWLPVDELAEHLSPVLVDRLQDSQDGTISGGISVADRALEWLAIPIQESDRHTLLVTCRAVPNRWSSADSSVLRSIANLIANELEPSAEQSPGPSIESQIVNASAEGLIALDASGICTFSNQAGARMLGYDPDDLIGQPLHRLLHAHHTNGTACDSATCPMSRWYSGETVTVSEDLFTRRDQSQFPVEYMIQPQLDDDGQVTGAFLRFTDTSQIRHALDSARFNAAQHQAFLEMALDAIVTIDTDGMIIGFNPAAQRIFGYETSEVVGQEMAELLIPSPWRDWYRQGFTEYVSNGSSPMSGRRVSMSAIRSNGVVFPAEFTVTRLSLTDTDIYTWYIRDLSEHKWNERRRQARYAVTRVLAENQTANEAMPRILETLGNGLEWDWVAFWSIDDQRNALVFNRAWHRASLNLTTMERAYRTRTFGLGEGVIGNVWNQREAAWIPDVNEAPAYIWTPETRDARMYSMAAFPIIGRHSVLGIIELLSVDFRHHDEEMMRLLASLGSQIGQFIERKEIEDERAQLLEREQAARAEAQAAERRIAFLAEASTHLSESLDYHETLSKVTQLVVPRMADYCAIHALTDEGRIMQLGIADIDPEKERQAREMRRKYPTLASSNEPAAQVIRTGRSIVYPEVTEDILRTYASDDEHLEFLRTAGIDSAMHVPLTARGRTFGTMSFVSAESGHRYGPGDLAFAEDIGQRAALAIDNARLYTETQNAVKIREEFLSIASHELKTPLTTVKGYSQIFARLLQHQTLDRMRLIELSNQLQKQLGRFETLIVDLLDVSRIQQGRLEMRPEQTDLVELARTVLSRFESVSEAHREHSLHLESPDSIVGYWDPDRLDQVLTNLVSNAVKYSPEGGQVIVHIGVNGDQVCLSVSDQGIGIPEEEQNQLFRPFQRSETVSRAISGVGLGLYISRQIVERHGGTIEIESEPGLGSTFNVELPISPPDEALTTSNALFS